MIGEYIHPSSLMSTDTANNYKKFAKIKGLQHVNNFHNCLKGWLERLQVAGTYYWDNYLYWFRWLELGKKNWHLINAEEQLLISACQNSNYSTVEMLIDALKHPKYEVDYKPYLS